MTSTVPLNIIYFFSLIFQHVGIRPLFAIRLFLLIYYNIYRIFIHILLTINVMQCIIISGHIIPRRYYFETMIKKGDIILNLHRLYKEKKMKTKTNKIAAITFILTAVLLLGMTTSVFASTENTTANVEFSQNPEVNKLEIVTAPGIDFGSRVLPSGGETITADAINGNLRISDTRGTFEGWLVTAKLSNFSTQDVSNSMPGAYITLNNGEATKIGTGSSESPLIEDSITLISGAEDTVSIANANKNGGIGTWAINWLAENVELTMLDTPAKGANTATINWTLTSAAEE